jgi:putative endonuclease
MILLSETTKPVIARSTATKQSLTMTVNKQYYVYITTNKNNGVLYTGVTNDLKRRIYEHKGKLVKGSTKKYNVDKLVFYEVYDEVENAITREKQIKGGSRQKKIDLINKNNHEWRDLYEEL